MVRMVSNGPDIISSCMHRSGSRLSVVLKSEIDRSRYKCQTFHLYTERGDGNKQSSTMQCGARVHFHVGPRGQRIAAYREAGFWSYSSTVLLRRSDLRNLAGTLSLLYNSANSTCSPFALNLWDPLDIIPAHPARFHQGFRGSSGLLPSIPTTLISPLFHRVQALCLQRHTVADRTSLVLIATNVR